MDKMRERHVAEMDRLKDAMRRTSSNHLRCDYGKALKRMQTVPQTFQLIRRQSILHLKLNRFQV